jgi:hypothetical protein
VLNSARWLRSQGKYNPELKQIEAFARMLLELLPG